MSGYLLDTHAVIWWWTADRRLGASARDVLAAGDADVHLSAASVWEIAIKSDAGRLPEIVDFRGEYPGLMAANNFAVLAVSDRHALTAGYLAGEHRDPFDRLIAAQALIEGLTVVTRDAEFARFGCEVLW